jgi:AAHS family 4-hydroxybenzoate transporter-like MFS transporter
VIEPVAAAEDDPSRFNLQAFIDHRAMTPLQWWVLCGGIAMLFIDGFDIFIVGKIAPAIAKSFGQEPKAMTLVFAAQQIGLAIGAFLGTPLGDRYGRRALLIISAGIFGVLTLACAFVTSLVQLAILRGLSGLCLAGIVPLALAYITEFTPIRRRSVLISTGMIGYSLGNAAGGLIAAWLLQRFGWQSGFVVGGALPLLFLLLLIALPESLPFLVARRPDHPAVLRTLLRMDPTLQLPRAVTFVGAASDRVRGRLRNLLRGRLLRPTAIFWSTSFLSMANIALLAAWLPSFFLQMAGVPIEKFAVAALIASLGGVAGILTVGALVDRVGPSRMLSICYVLLAVSVMLLGVVPFASLAFVPTLLVWSFFQAGGQGGINIYIARSYPVTLRSTGLGWAGGAGRIGGIVAPILGGLALSAHLSLTLTMALTAIPSLLIALLFLVPARPEAPSDSGSVRASGAERVSARS